MDQWLLDFEERNEHKHMRINERSSLFNTCEYTKNLSLIKRL